MQVAEDDDEWWEEVPGVEQDGKGKKNKKYLKGNDMCDPIYSVQSTTWTSYSYSYLLDLGVQNGGKLTDRRRNDVETKRFQVDGTLMQVNFLVAPRSISIFVMA